MYDWILDSLPNLDVDTYKNAEQNISFKNLAVNGNLTLNRVYHILIATSEQIYNKLYRLYISSLH